jgi:hypothetical protein
VERDSLARALRQEVASRQVEIFHSTLGLE